jgi:hypothetical protein
MRLVGSWHRGVRNSLYEELVSTAEQAVTLEVRESGHHSNARRTTLNDLGHIAGWNRHRNRTDLIINQVVENIRLL